MRTKTCEECEGRCVLLEMHGADISEVDCESCDGKGEIQTEDEDMTREEKQEWMEVFCANIGATLDLEGECGFGRECVGILVNGNYPDYIWYSSDYSDRLDGNGDVWTPEDAYHKHSCVAVLGRGEAAEGQLYTWLQWFAERNYRIHTGRQPVQHAIQAMMGQDRFARMVKGENL